MKNNIPRIVIGLTLIIAAAKMNDIAYRLHEYTTSIARAPRDAGDFLDGKPESLVVKDPVFILGNMAYATFTWITYYMDLLGDMLVAVGFLNAVAPTALRALCRPFVPEFIRTRAQLAQSLPEGSLPANPHPVQEPS